MRICRYTLNSDVDAVPRLGVFDDDSVRDVTAAADDLPAFRWPLPMGDALIEHLPALMPRIAELAVAAPPIPRSDVSLLSPVANPGKLVCGLGNWSFHKMPLGTMGFLYKVTSAATGEGTGVQVRWPDRETLYEPELAIVIGRKCTNVSEAEALQYVAGYTCVLDMTMKKENEDFSFCKSFDTFGVLGPCLVTADEIADPSALSYKFWVGDELRGERNFSDLTASPAQLVAFASTTMTLHPGDVIFSGAADVAPVFPGEIMTLEIPGIGRMVVPVSVSTDARAGVLAAPQ
ncbi:MAG: hydrolase family protein [Novosphingobium sp.]|nr:hydrolase family protein [Novosphingobium sp.]